MPPEWILRLEQGDQLDLLLRVLRFNNRPLQEGRQPKMPKIDSPDRKIHQRALKRYHNLYCASSRDIYSPDYSRKPKIEENPRIDEGFV